MNKSAYILDQPYLTVPTALKMKQEGYCKIFCKHGGKVTASFVVTMSDAQHAALVPSLIHQKCLFFIILKYEI